MSAALALALAVAATGSDSAGSTEALRRVYDGAKGAMVQVGADGVGSGVVIGESGIIVTANGLVKGHDTVPITFANGFSATARVVATSEAVGSALLRLDGLPPMAFVRVAAAGPKPNQAAYGFAQARPGVPSINFGRVGSTEVVRDDQIDDRLFTVRFGFRPRSVGGAVLSWNGELLGVVLANDSTGTSFCASIGALLGFISEHSEKLPTVAVQFESDPSGATVLVDGDPVGHTPLPETQVLAGRHTIIWQAPGLPDTIRPFTALGRAHQKLAPELFPGAALEVRTLPLAQVWVDGVYRAQGSTTLWVPSGRHWVGSVLRGHRDFGRWVELVEGRTVAVEVDLPAEHATLSVATTPPGASVTLDDNRLGLTPLEKVPVDPGAYEVTLAARGYHAAHVPVVVHDGQDVDLGKVRLEPPRATLKSRVPPDTEVSIDGEPRHAVSSLGESAAPGPHQLTYFAPYQYRTTVSAGGEDGKVVEVKPKFVMAGDPADQSRFTSWGALTAGAGGLAALVSGVCFLAAAVDGSGQHTLPSAGHTEIGVGLATGGLALGLFAGGALLNSLQPTPDMGWNADPP